LNGADLISKIRENEIHDAHRMLIEIRETCKKFKKVYYEYKDKSEGRWNIMHSALFLRLESFIDRCMDLEHVIETNINYNVLKDVIIGGTKGDKFTSDIKIIMEMFEKTKNEFTAVTYDVMDVEVETKNKFSQD